MTASNLTLSKRTVCHLNKYDHPLEHAATWHNTFVVPAAPDCYRKTGYIWGVWVDSEHRKKVWKRLPELHQFFAVYNESAANAP